MDYMAELAAIAQEHGGIIETKTAIAHGISKAMLYKLCKEDKIHRIVKGQYILPDDMQDELLSISKRSNQIIFSHETALFLHGISDRTPFEHTITVNTSSRTFGKYSQLNYDDSQHGVKGLGYSQQTKISGMYGHRICLL